MTEKDRKRKGEHLRAQSRWAAAVTVIVLLLLLCIYMVAGCSSDDEVLPAYEGRLCEIVTDGAGRGYLLRDDDGGEAAIGNVLKGLAADSVYRVFVLMVKGEGGAVTLKSAQSIFSVFPHEAHADDVMGNDALEVITAWRSPRYVNLRVALMTDGLQKHMLDFIDEGTRANADGTLTKCIRLCHDQNGAARNYREEGYVSCPIYQYSEELRSGTDSIRLVANVGGKDYEYSVQY